MSAAVNGHALAVKALLAGGADMGQVDKVRKKEGRQYDGLFDVGDGFVVSSSELRVGRVAPLADGPSTAPQTLPSTTVRAWGEWG
jgi:hypothetical protein